MLSNHIAAMNDSPATKEDLLDLERRLENFILNRELLSLRWSVGIQIAYFSITLAAVYFLIHYK
jgi:hypothetical protein